jgi:hypothetical protein
LDVLRRGAAASHLIRENWWAERGSQRYLNHDKDLEAAVLYVRDGQDGSARFDR